MKFEQYSIVDPFNDFLKYRSSTISLESEKGWRVGYGELVVGSHHIISVLRYEVCFWWWLIFEPTHTAFMFYYGKDIYIHCEVLSHLYTWIPLPVMQVSFSSYHCPAKRILNSLWLCSQLCSNVIYITQIVSNLCFLPVSCSFPL